jgi:flagellar export protein FliJ
MREFRFRAGAALDLRRQQEQDAARVLAQAEAHLRAARDLVAHAEAQRVRAQTDQLDDERRGTDGRAVLWHRNWIAGLSASVTRLTHELAPRQDAVRIATQRWQDARRRRLSLERLRDRALRRYRQDELREELKVIDELARLRFVTPDEGDEGNRRDD